MNPQTALSEVHAAAVAAGADHLLTRWSEGRASVTVLRPLASRRGILTALHILQACGVDPDTLTQGTDVITGLVDRGGVQVTVRVQRGAATLMPAADPPTPAVVPHQRAIAAACGHATPPFATDCGGAR